MNLQQGLTKQPWVVLSLINGFSLSSFPYSEERHSQYIWEKYRCRHCHMSEQSYNSIALVIGIPASTLMACHSLNVSSICPLDYYVLGKSICSSHLPGSLRAGRLVGEGDPNAVSGTKPIYAGSLGGTYCGGTIKPPPPKSGEVCFFWGFILYIAYRKVYVFHEQKDIKVMVWLWA